VEKNLEPEYKYTVVKRFFFRRSHNTSSEVKHFDRMNCQTRNDDQGNVHSLNNECDFLIFSAVSCALGGLLRISVVKMLNYTK
jgi:hypothetical protein